MKTIELNKDPNRKAMVGLLTIEEENDTKVQASRAKLASINADTRLTSAVKKNKQNQQKAQISRDRTLASTKYLQDKFVNLAEILEKAEDLSRSNDTSDRFTILKDFIHERTGNLSQELEDIKRMHSEEQALRIPESLSRNANSLDVAIYQEE